LPRERFHLHGFVQGSEQKDEKDPTWKAHEQERQSQDGLSRMRSLRTLCVGTPQAKKKVLTQFPYHAFVSSQVFATITDAPHLWVVDLGSSDHVTWDKDEFMEYRCISTENRRLFMGNDSSAKVSGIGAFQLVFKDGSTLLLYDVLHVPKIWRNLFICVEVIKFRPRC